MTNEPVGLTLEGHFFVSVGLVKRDPETLKPDPDRAVYGFFDYETFRGLTVAEQARNLLPTFRLEFTLYDLAVLPYLNQGNQVWIRMGPDPENTVSSRFVIVKPTIVEAGQGMRAVVLEGMLDAVPYLVIRRPRSFSRRPSSEVIRTVVEPHFGRDAGMGGLDFPEEKTDDAQVWVQPGITDRRFVTQLQGCGHFPDSFPLLGILSDGSFRYRNFRSLARKDEPDWIFTFEVDDEDDRCIAYNRDVADVSRAAVLNAWKGSGSRIPVYDADVGGMPVMRLSHMDPGLLSGASHGNRDPRIPARVEPVSYNTGNMHPHFWEARSRNLQGLALYSSQALRFSYGSVYKPVKVLDVVQFHDVGGFVHDDRARDSSGKEPHLPPNDYASGRYLVSKVTRSLTNRQVKTYVELCRESPVGLEGQVW